MSTHFATCPGEELETCLTTGFFVTVGPGATVHALFSLCTCAPGKTLIAVNCKVANRLNAGMEAWTVSRRMRLSFRSCLYTQ